MEQISRTSESKWTDLAVSSVWQRLEYIIPVCDGSKQMLMKRKVVYKTQTDGRTDNMQFFVWYGSQNFCQTISQTKSSRFWYSTQCVWIKFSDGQFPKETAIYSFLHKFKVIKGNLIRLWFPTFIMNFYFPLGTKHLINVESRWKSSCIWKLR